MLATLLSAIRQKYCRQARRQPLGTDDSLRGSCVTKNDTKIINKFLPRGSDLNVGCYSDIHTALDLPNARIQWNTNSFRKILEKQASH